MELDPSVLLTTEGLVALLTLTALEIVLGIDNIIFISILSSKLPAHQQHRARQVGLSLAMITRIALLLSLSWIMGLTAPLFSVWEHTVSGRDLVLLVGGLFLIWKATMEIHDKVEGHDEARKLGKVPTFGAAIFQILLLDIVFSLDSVITAVGMARHVVVMIVAVMLAVAVMLVAAGPVSAFVERHPTVKVLALAFLVMIGVGLLIEGSGGHVPKGYIYFAMGFSVLVEGLNLRMKRNAERRSAGPR